MTRRLEGKGALITGGASGIGEATVRAMRDEGAHVAIADLQEERGRALAEELGEGVEMFVLAVTRQEDWQRVMGEVADRIGDLHIVVNSAGVSVPGPIDATDFEAWRHTMSINADGVFLGCKYGVEALRRAGGGSIVNLSSTFGIRAGSAFAAYCASKGAVRMLTKSVALRCAEAGWGIRCNSVHPGATETPMIEPYMSIMPTREEGMAQLASAQPMGRLGQPEEVAQAAVFLASDDSSFITGVELPVDGGHCA